MEKVKNNIARFGQNKLTKDKLSGAECSENKTTESGVCVARRFQENVLNAEFTNTKKNFVPESALNATVMNKASYEQNKKLVTSKSYETAIKSADSRLCKSYSVQENVLNTEFMNNKKEQLVPYAALRKAKMNQMPFEQRKIATNKSYGSVVSKNKSADSGVGESHSTFQENTVPKTEFIKDRKEHLIPHSVSSKAKINKTSFKQKKLDINKLNEALVSKNKSVDSRVHESYSVQENAVSNTKLINNRKEYLEPHSALSKGKTNKISFGEKKFETNKSYGTVASKNKTADSGVYASNSVKESPTSSAKFINNMKENLVPRSASSKAKTNKESFVQKANKSCETKISKNKNSDCGVSELRIVHENTDLNTALINKKEHLIPDASSSSQCKENGNPKVEKKKIPKKCSLKSYETAPKCIPDSTKLSLTKTSNRNTISLSEIRFVSKKHPNEILNKKSGDQTPLEMRKSKKEILHLQEPPESFRSLSVLPIAADIKLPCLFLRPNIVEGKYKNTEHYLDVQYRLLREDYVKPLRDGIAEYLNLKKNGESFKKCKNVKVYTSVYIAGEDFQNGDLIHVLQFSDEGFLNIKWNQTKRLLTQSLLCLSLDDFKTMLFASIIRRDPKELRKGFLYVHFEEITEVLNLDYSMHFVVLETSAYFEAYRHNLMALQQLDEKSLPLKTYIIDVEKNVNKPSYLRSTTSFDMRPLLLPLDKNHIKISHGTACYKYPRNISDDARSIKVLDDSHWPTASELKLDDSQYLALKSAITKEFAIVQGPPGTGKTYIGLRIVQLLLHNLDKWFSNDISSLPILIVCKTNHALDQFLEGLLLFTSKIVRIGGGSSNEKILKFQLCNLKYSMRKGQFSRCIYDTIKEKNIELKIIMKNIREIKKCVTNSTSTVLSEFQLREHMSLIHYETLQKRFLTQGYRNNTFTVYDWLGISSNSGKNVPKHYKNKPVEVIFETRETYEEFGSEDEAEVEYIENQRNIDFYDFENFSFRKNLKSIQLTDSDCSNNDSGWKKQESTEQSFEMDEYIRRCLEYFEAMTEDIAMTVNHVWDLEHGNRWKLYKYWLQKFIKKKEKDFFNLIVELKANRIQEIKEMRTEEDLYVLKQAHIIGMTTNGAAKYRHLVQRLNPVILVVEEAAEVLESHIVTSLAPNTQHVILIGDQQQLRPSPTVHMLAVKYDLNISLFERMVMNGVDYCRLSVQHRMRPEIAALIVPHIYSNLENHKVVTEFESIKGVDKNVFFLSHCFNESSKRDSNSKVNEYEAKFLIQFCRYLILQGYDPSQITVLTTYSAQHFVLKHLASATEDVKKVHFTVVDNFQGEENDIILISFVRSNDDGIVGFLKVPNRVCVALSRAKKGLFCIGNFTLLAEKSSLWKNISNTLNQEQSIGPSLRLRCQNHPDTYSEVASVTDFMKVPDGGCNRKCEFRHPCGHGCILMCHPYDQGHKILVCKKPCLKMCERNHQCQKRCFQKCYCKVLVDKTLNKCGHTIKEMCGKPEDEIICPLECERLLSCAHKCVQICGEECGLSMKPCIKIYEKGHKCEKKCFQIYCKAYVDKTLKKCGHIVNEWCGKPEEKIICPLQCENLLRCTHLCSNKCGKKCAVNCKEPCLQICKNGHQCQKMCFELCGSCKVLVDKTFKPCGHTVKVSCGESNFLTICSIKCKKTLNCSHKCSKKCGETCDTRCKEPCLKTCEKSHRCEKKCFEMCYCMVMVDKLLVQCGHTVKIYCGKLQEEITCSFKCKIKLHCNHYCGNKCSEPCVETCIQLTEIVLPTCGHSVKVPCYIANNSEILLKKSTEEFFKTCSEQCKEVLPCGHTCMGTCGRCYQKRLHVPCDEPCERVLMCGHKCGSSCSKSCPPCQHPCENKCIHTKCRNKCGTPCKKCTKTCEWSCSHKKCTRPCYEICNRKPCNEPCMEILPCSHPCIGFCGEPCPKLCRICDNKTKDSIFYRFEDGEKFVLLEDCDHVFEFQGLNQWITVISKGNKKICMKTCPTCKTVIRKNLRYNNIIKISLLQLENIKKITGYNKERNFKFQRILWEKSVSLISFAYFKPYNNLNKCLSSSLIRNINELTHIENIISIATDLNLLNIKHIDLGHSSQPHALRMLLKYACITSQWVVDFILKYFLYVSEYQLLQLTYEVHRLRLIGRLLQYAQPEFFESQCLEFENCSKCLLNYVPFNDDRLMAFTSYFQVLTSKFDCEGISTLIKFPFLKAMNLSANHWYTCSKGHAYCIIDYIGTSGKGCYECIKKIEGPLFNPQNLSNISLTRNSSFFPQHLTTNSRAGSKSRGIHRVLLSPKAGMKQEIQNSSCVSGYAQVPAPLKHNSQRPCSRPSDLSASGRIPANLVSRYSRPPTHLKNKNQRLFSRPSHASVGISGNPYSGYHQPSTSYNKNSFQRPSNTFVGKPTNSLLKNLEPHMPCEKYIECPGQK